MQAQRICLQQYKTFIQNRLVILNKLSVSELKYFPSVENIEISLYAQAWQSLLLLTQGNIYNC